MSDVPHRDKKRAGIMNNTGTTGGPLRLVDPQTTIKIIRESGFVFRKRFGQNFLIDARVLQRIVEAANVSSGDFVLEIGPGIGTLTQALAERAGCVVAVEIDRDLVEILGRTLDGYRNVTVIQADIMKTDIAELMARHCGGRQAMVVANLPYYITTPLLMRILESADGIKSITALIQKEVADRIMASPGTKEYGALSLAVQYRALPRIAANVPANCFMPRPKVGSAVVHFDIYAKKPIAAKDEDMMFRLVRAAFSQRRKTLPNSVLQGTGIEKARVSGALESMGIAQDIRGEELSVEQFARLSDIISDGGL